MAKGIFITATGTDIGKTYVTALLNKAMHENGFSVGYYKAALSGAKTISESDAGYANRISGVAQREDTLLSYLYKNPLSPHLAARIEGNPVSLERIKADFAKVKSVYDYITVEGSGGIVCPIRLDETETILLEDIVKALQLPTLLVAEPCLGSIHAVVTTIEYIRHHGMECRGIVLNHWHGGIMEEDNAYMMEHLTNVKVLAKIPDGAECIDIDIPTLATLYGEV